MSDFVVGDIVRVPNIKAKHVLESQERGDGMWSVAESVASRLLGEEGRIIEMGLPYGVRGTRTGVLVEFVYRRLRRLPPEIGDGYYTDDAGEHIYDEFTTRALVTTSMLAPTGAELLLGYMLWQEREL
jgi:hypothetical protein